MAMDLQQVNYRALLIAPQLAAGTPTTLLPATHGMLVINGDYNFQADPLEREIDQVGHGARPMINVGRRSAYTGMIELRGAATVGNAAPCGRVLRCCGFGETLTASTSAVYGLVTSGHEIFTLGGYRAGSLVSGIDARGALTQIEMSIKNFAKAQFSIMALPGATPVSDAALPSADLSTFQPPVPIETESFEVDIGGVKLNTLSVTVDTQAQVAVYEGSEGRFVYWSQLYRPQGTIKVFKEQRSVFNPESIALAHTTQAVWAEIVGGGETVRLDLSTVQLGLPTSSEEQGIACWDIPFRAIGSTPTNCLALSFLTP